MDFKSYLKEKDQQQKQQNFLSFQNEELAQLSREEIRHLMDFFHGYTLMKLPQTEIDFFEWLKQTDRPVWDDIWGDEENQYLVSVDLLEQVFTPNSRFPMCDLIDLPNFWFSPEHIKPEGAEAMIDIGTRVEAGQRLELEEELLLRIAEASMDIWHYGYEHQIDIERLKAAIEEMVFRGWIVHLPDREDLIKYLDF